MSDLYWITIDDLPTADEMEAFSEALREHKPDEMDCIVTAKNIKPIDKDERKEMVEALIEGLDE